MVQRFKGRGLKSGQVLWLLKKRKEVYGDALQVCWWVDKCSSFSQCYFVNKNKTFKGRSLKVEHAKRWKWDERRHTWTFPNNISYKEFFISFPLFSFAIFPLRSNCYLSRVETRRSEWSKKEGGSDDLKRNVEYHDNGYTRASPETFSRLRFR